MLMAESLGPVNSRDLETFENEFKILLHDWMLTTDTPASIAEKSTGRLLLQTTMAIRRAGLSMPTDLLRLHRTTLVSDMVELQLYPQLNLMQEMQEFFREDAQRRLCEGFDKDEIVEWVEDSAYVAMNWVRTTRSVLEWVDSRLPQISRSLEYEITRVDEAFAISTHFLRSLVWLSVPAVVSIWIFGGLIPSDAVPPFSWARSLAESLNGYLVVLWVLVASLVDRVLSQIERPLRT
jgi:predicted unusual protein kinase regulating ubiquinone biosynthesis (AarF/ABC1/UbiB family)